MWLWTYGNTTDWLKWCFIEIKVHWRDIAAFEIALMSIPTMCICRTPLMLAVMGGHVDAVSLLLEREATVDMADHQGLTALHLGVSFLILSTVWAICKHKFCIWRKDALPFPVGEIKAEENRGKQDYGRVFKIYCPPVFETKRTYV